MRGSDLTRVFVIDDVRGERRLDDQALPLCLGGAEACDIVMPGVPADQQLAFVALEDGHAYIQPAADGLLLYHNHEQLNGSRWLKSGDEVRLDDAVMEWRVQGDITFVTTRVQPLASPAVQSAPTVPLQPPPHAALPDVALTSPSEPRRSWRWPLSIVFAVLLLAALFVLLATPLTVSISPQPDTQAIRGFPPALKLGERLLALPGRYQVSASLAGYRPLQADIVVQRGELQHFEMQLEELPGQVQIQLHPAVAYRVSIAGEALATDADGVTGIPGGRHTLLIETQRYLPVTAEVDILGRGQSQQLEFTLQPGWADVRIDSEPPGATVRIDATGQGTTPLTTEVMAGQREIEVSLALHKSITLQQVITAGETIELDTVQLEAADGQLSVSSEPSGATISVADNFHGITPATLSLASGTELTVRLSKPGYRQVARQVSLQPQETQELSVSLPPEYGIVFVTARPADASMKIDGKPSGEATRRLRLTTRAHTLSFSKPGYVSQQITVTPRVGVSKSVDVTLKTQAQLDSERKAASTPALLTTAGGQQLRLIRPDGSFTMGASRREAGRRANESARLVQLDRPFYLAEKEVSNAQFRRFRAAHNSGMAEGVSLGGDTLPVVNVSWADAARYCNWLSDRDRLPHAYRETNGKMVAVAPMTTGYRLPTEAEWAFVARKLGRQQPARYPWSGQYPPKSPSGNFADASIADTLADTVPDYNDGFRGAAPVGSFAGQSGFHDLGGNVAEWMHDYYAVYPGMANTLVTDPGGPVTGDHHVVRGSSWRQGSIAELRLSYRDYSREPRPDLGFRIARYAE
jgi:formylglycine-generating enzyme required for sulfatase activity